MIFYALSLGCHWWDPTMCSNATILWTYYQALTQSNFRKIFGLKCVTRITTFSHWNCTAKYLNLVNSVLAFLIFLKNVSKWGVDGGHSHLQHKTTLRNITRCITQIILGLLSSPPACPLWMCNTLILHVSYHVEAPQGIIIIRSTTINQYTLQVLMSLRLTFGFFLKSSSTVLCVPFYHSHLCPALKNLLEIFWYFALLI